MLPKPNFLVTPRALRLLFTIKIILVAVIVLRMNNVIHFGDKDISAADGPAPTTPEKASGSDAKPAPEAKSSAAESTESAGKSAYKSALDELFDLPAFSGDDLKKEEINRYFNILEKKKKEIEERITFVQNRQGSLEELEQIIDKKLQRLEEERRFFNDTVQKERDLKDGRLDKLVEFYMKMSPKKAAPVFESLNKDLVVELFNRLPQKQIMGILELMQPQKSVELSEYFGRVRSGKEYDLLKELNNSLKDEFRECRDLAAKS